MVESLEILEDSGLKKRIAMASFGLALLWLALKSYGAWASGSVGLLAEAAEAGLDLLSSLMTFLVVGAADQPPDKDHPYGHGKYEQGAAFFQSGIMLVMSGGIVWQAIERWISQEPLRDPGSGIVVLCITGTLGVAWGRYLMGKAKSTASPAIAAYGRMIIADGLTDFGVILVLVLYIFTHMLLWDVLISLFVAVYIAYEGSKSAYLAWRDFSDHSLPPEEEELIGRIVMEYPQVEDLHNLRTRAAGAYRLIDFHVRLCRSLTLMEVQYIAESLQDKVEKNVPRSNVLVHVDSCERCEGPESCATYRSLNPLSRERIELIDALVRSTGEVDKAAELLGKSPEEFSERAALIGVDPAFFKDPQSSRHGVCPSHYVSIAARPKSGA